MWVDAAEVGIGVLRGWEGWEDQTDICGNVLIVKARFAM
jgi:hypothetical protein